MSITRTQAIRYSAIGVPLGFLGLPLYMHLPHYYAGAFGMSLSILGAIFMVSRLVDCLIDPWLGQMLDRARSAALIIIAAAITIAGMVILFTLPVWFKQPPPAWGVAAILVITYVGYSVLCIRFYASGVRLAATPHDAAHVSSWREGALICGIVMAAVLPGFGVSYPQLAALYGALLIMALWMGRRIMSQYQPFKQRISSLWASVRQHQRLYIIFFFNALAPAITATLYLFYVADVLHAADAAAMCLLAYFVAALVTMPFWVKLASMYGKIPCLVAAMSLAVISFLGAAQLGAGDVTWFVMICILTGIAFGADAALLPSLLSDDLQHTRAHEHTAFGIWIAISKLALALAAGIALPAVEALQSAGISTDQAIRLTYSMLPCVIKAAALICLLSYYRHQQRSLG